MPIQIERLTRSHDRNAFGCGEPPLNNYLQRLALQNDERGIGRTFVAVVAGETHIKGYYTLATGKVIFENMPETKKLPPRMPVPVVLLGRLAVDNGSKGSGLGRLLLMHALWRSQQIAAHAGVYAVEVDALHEQAAKFYLKYGFTPLLDDPLHLYLSMKTVEALNLDFDGTE
jgi:GNAT superfamily N-acetyltransferase